MSNQSIGIIGGVGLAASIALEERIVELLEASNLQERQFPKIVSIHDASIPDRSAYISGQGPNPAAKISEIMDTLGKLNVTVMGMPCNTAHAQSILGKIHSRFQDRLISIIDVTMQALIDQIRKGSVVGLMATQGTYAAGIYKEAITTAGLTYAEPDDDAKHQLMDIIYTIKSEGNSQATDRQLYKLHTELAQTCDAVVLGCTELGLSSITEHSKSIDSLTELARALVAPKPSN